MLTQTLSLTASVLSSINWMLIAKIGIYYWICSFLFLCVIFITGDLTEDFPEDADDDLF